MLLAKTVCGLRRCHGRAVEIRAEGEAGRQPRAFRCRDFSRRRAETAVEFNGTAFYRKYTAALLRKYLRVSMQVGKVPACLPKEMFRGQVTAYRMRNFEDGVIFVRDMDRCLAQLDARSLEVLTRVVIQAYTQEEVAVQMGYSTRHLIRLMNLGLDRLSDVLLERGMLELGA